ncbi:MAG: HIT family protein [Deltaproteobacteria bacterium]|nr:HIT family protein [Deltaproteobacteria bacterium]MBW2361297.1 HIT family protein [Deltaproteobacteria bacterium]
MASIFTKIIGGELPGRFVWKDEHVVAFLTINPIRPGHTLVVPRQEVDHWIDMSPELARRVMDVSRAVGQAIQQAFAPTKVGASIVGLEVPHVHVHLIPIDGMQDLDFGRADSDPTPAAMDAAASAIRTALREHGHAEVSD